MTSRGTAAAIAPGREGIDARGVLIEFVLPEAGIGARTGQPVPVHEPDQGTSVTAVSVAAQYLGDVGVPRRRAAELVVGAIAEVGPNLIIIILLLLLLL